MPDKKVRETSERLKENRGRSNIVRALTPCKFS